MALQVLPRGYDFDDVLVMPRISTVGSRKLVNLGRDFVRASDGISLHLDLPFFSAPMDKIVPPEMVVALGRLGAMGILHRFFHTLPERMAAIDYVAAECKNFGVAIGLPDANPDEWTALDYALHKGAKVICLDIANGYLTRLHSQLRLVAKRVHAAGALLMSGNVVEMEGVLALAQNGTDMVRVGIGGGQLCTTRNKTGVGCPQLTAVSLAAEAKDTVSLDGNEIVIVSDGGIRNAGDAFKAFAARADAIMFGTILATTFESGHDGKIYGMASQEHQQRFYAQVGSNEGLCQKAEKVISLEAFLSDFAQNLRSACTYLGISNLSDASAHAIFVETGSGTIKKLT